MDRIAVFARWPEAGRVKTRLSPALPPSMACELHRAMLEDAIDAAIGAEADERFLYWADAPDPPVAAPGSAPIQGLDHLVARHQKGADLGERLERAFAELLVDPADRVVILGADCPMLDAAMLRAALGSLSGIDLVLGPTRDGGYYLVGLTLAAPDLFHDIAWGTSRTLEQTRERAHTLGLTFVQLPDLEDLDTPEDLVRWIRLDSRGEAKHGIHTREALRSMGLSPPMRLAGA